jgi:putative Mg2+ transporter-C (MgtC) family protein
VIPDLEWWDVLLRLAVAAALTGAIGLERELRDRAAGLRTHMLVGVGSALFTIVSAYGWGDFGFSTREGVVFDPTRIAAQIVTGIGFLGAGAIIRQGLSVRGLTTAAGLWVVAAIGMAVGAGYYSAALIATGIVLVGLGPFRWLEGGTALARFRQAGHSLEVDLTPEHSIAEPLAVMDERRVRINRVEFEDQEDRRRLLIQLDVPLGQAEERLVEDLAALEGVVAVRWSE